MAAREWEYYANGVRIATAVPTSRDDGILGLLGRGRGGCGVGCVSEGGLGPERSRKFKTLWRGKRKLHVTVSPLLPFMLSELSVRQLKEMTINDTLFVPQSKTSGPVQRWGPQESKRMSYERGGGEEH